MFRFDCSNQKWFDSFVNFFQYSFTARFDCLLFGFGLNRSVTTIHTGVWRELFCSRSVWIKTSFTQHIAFEIWIKAWHSGSLLRNPFVFCVRILKLLCSWQWKLFRIIIGVAFNLSCGEHIKEMLPLQGLSAMVGGWKGCLICYLNVVLFRLRCLHCY